MWVDVLSDVPDQALQAAASEYLKSPAEWRPVPGKLRARALELCNASPDAVALAVWNKYGDIDDEQMLKDTRASGDSIAVEAIRQMRARMRRISDPSDIYEVMAARMAAFTETYKELMARGSAVGLPSGIKLEYARLNEPA